MVTTIRMLSVMPTSSMGGTSDELELLDVKRLPSGLIQLVEEHPFNLYEEALETGFIVEMTRRGSTAGGWMKFTSSVIMNSSEPFQSHEDSMLMKLEALLNSKELDVPEIANNYQKLSG